MNVKEWVARLYYSLLENHVGCLSEYNAVANAIRQELRHTQFILLHPKELDKESREIEYKGAVNRLRSLEDSLAKLEARL